MKTPEQIKIIAKVTCNDGFAYVLNRMPHFLYTKLDWKTIIGEDEGMYEFYMYDRYTDRYKAFGGRQFQLPLTDGSVEKCYGQYIQNHFQSYHLVYEAPDMRKTIHHPPLGMSTRTFPFIYYGYKRLLEKNPLCLPDLMNGLIRRGK